MLVWNTRKYEKILVYSQHRASMYQQSHWTPNEVRETAIGRLITGCINVWKHPTYFYRGAVLFGNNNATLFRVQFSLFEFFRTSENPPKSPYKAFKVFHSWLYSRHLKSTPPPYLTSRRATTRCPLVPSAIFWDF